MNEKSSSITPEDIEEKFSELKEEADEISGPSILLRRVIAAGMGTLLLFLVYLAGKRSGNRTKTFIEVVRTE